MQKIVVQLNVALLLWPHPPPVYTAYRFGVCPPLSAWSELFLDANHHPSHAPTIDGKVDFLFLSRAKQGSPGWMLY
jgi:hypothetical protein